MVNIMRFLYWINLVLCLTIFSVNAQNLNTTVSFIEPEKFTDFKIKADLRTKDRQILMQQLKELISLSVNSIMPSDVRFQIAIHDVDMAGGFLRGHNNIFRVIHESDRSSLHFSYVMLNSQGETIKKDTIYLTNRNLRLLKREGRKYNRTYFKTEMMQFDKWLLGINPAV